MALGDIGTYETYGFRLAGASGAMAAGLAAASPIFAFRNSTASRKLRILAVNLNASVGATGFTAGAALFSMFVARTYSASDTGGTALSALSAGNNSNKLRTAQTSSFILTGGGDVRIASTGTLTAGTRTLDANPVGNIVCPAGAAGTVMIQDTPVYSDYTTLYGVPLVLAQNEGFVITATVPATGTWQFGVNVLWAEVDGGAAGTG